MHYWLQFRHFLGYRLHRLPAGFNYLLELKLKLGMLLYQVLEKPERPAIGGVGLSGSRKAPGCGLILALSGQGDAKILVSVGAIGIDLDSKPVEGEGQ